MDNDLNTPEALAALDKLVTSGYAVSDHLGRAAVANTIFQLGKTLGLFGSFLSVRLTPEQRQLLRRREEARQRRDFRVADEIRASFAAEGLAIEDTPEGPVVLLKS
jgi:cysteinyl-tRNA synthetase